MFFFDRAEKVLPLCRFRPFVADVWYEGWDYGSDTLLVREIAHQFSDCEVQDAETERTKDRDSRRILFWRRCVTKNVGQSAANEVAMADKFFRQGHGSFRAANVVHGVDDVVSAEDDFGFQVAQRDVQNRAAGKTGVEVLDPRIAGRRREDRK